MANLLDLIQGNEEHGAFDQLQREFNLSAEETKSAVNELVPALRRGLQKNTESSPGMDELLEALRTGDHGRYIGDPSTLGRPETIKDGNDILGHIFGSKEVSREVASRAAQKSGISSSILGKMLPVVASIVMGTLSKQVLGGGRSASRTDSGGILGSLLDGDRDGSIWDDVLGMAARSLLR